ncbi:hypothetical protein NKG94_05675 [Micromonospora sp. M12]
MDGRARRRPQAQGRRHHPDRPGRQGQVAGPLLLVLPGDAHRRGGALQKAVDDKNFDSPDLVAAGERLKELVDLQPFQKGSSARRTARRTDRPPPWATAERAWS